MQHAISVIASEHTRMRRALMLIDQLLEKLKNADQVTDTALLTTVLDYLESYTRTHHAKEERYLFKAMRSRSPRSRALLDEIEAMHGEEPKLVERMRALLSASKNGSGAQAREELIAALEDYRARQRQDMLKEETELLPLAARTLTQKDWQEVDEGYLLFDHLLDPVVGETYKNEFEQLYSRLILYAPEPMGLGLMPPQNGDKAAAAEAQMLGVESGLHGQFGHIRALNALSEEEWQAINDQYLHYNDPRFGAAIKEEIRQLQTRIAYAAPAPIGLGMEHVEPEQAPLVGDRLLEIKDLTCHYGRIQALNGVSLEMTKGVLVALVGSNGAGKSTLLRTICGLNNNSGGAIRFNGQDISRLPADRRVRMGIALSPEGRQVFAPMSVEDNLLLGAYSRRDAEQVAADLEQMYRLFPILKQKRKQPAGTLSGGQQQMLAMARALMARPQLLLLDEPSMGLAPILVEEIFNTIGELTRRGITILLVEQNAAAALKIADYGHVIETGNIVLSGRGRDLLEDERVKRAYLGR
jgi:ABC-type branched-subunit amino acid transport system ATPase component/hemerythrin-like domain-containing protein